MSQCTCAKDPTITCIVHPNERALKARIKKLEAEVKGLEDSLTIVYMCGYSDGKRPAKKRAAV